MTAMPSVSFERSVFYRERSSSMYSSAPYSVAMALVEVLLTRTIPRTRRWHPDFGGVGV